MRMQLSMTRAILVAIVMSFTAAPLIHPAWCTEEQISLSWDGCNPSNMNRSYDGPGLYSIYATLTGFSVPNYGHRLMVWLRGDVLGSPIPDAWRFDDEGCALGNLTVSHSSADPLCPAMQGPAPWGLYTFTGEDNRFQLEITSAYDRFVPDSDTRYLLWRVDFDHQQLVSKNPETEQCAGITEPVCFFLADAEYLDVDYSPTRFGYGLEVLTWQDPGGIYNSCIPRDVQAAPSTWGRVKSQYR